MSHGWIFVKAGAPIGLVDRAAGAPPAARTGSRIGPID
jgi:hypothetical protein